MANRKIVFSTENKGSLGLPTIMQAFMVVMFGMPAVALPLFTWREVPENPLILLFYIAAWFPLGVLYVLRRLMSRYALQVFDGGDSEIIYPFSTVQLPISRLHAIVVERHYLQATNSYATWIRFGDSEGKIITSLSPLAFRSEDIQTYFNTLRSFKPELIIQY